MKCMQLCMFQSFEFIRKNYIDRTRKTSPSKYEKIHEINNINVDFFVCQRGSKLETPFFILGKPFAFNCEHYSGF